MSLLATPAKVAVELGIDYSTATALQKENIDISIGVATEKIESFCRRKFEEKEYTAVLKVIGNSIVFPVYPILEITECSETLDYNEEIQMLDKGILLLDSTIINVIKVKYKAGWKLPGETGRNLPLSIEKAAIKLAAAEYISIGKKTNVNPVKSEKIFDYSYTLSEKVSSVGVNFSVDIVNLLAEWVIV